MAEDGDLRPSPVPPVPGAASPSSALLAAPSPHLRCRSLPRSTASQRSGIESFLSGSVFPQIFSHDISPLIKALPPPMALLRSYYPSRSSRSRVNADNLPDPQPCTRNCDISCAMIFLCNNSFTLCRFR